MEETATTPQGQSMEVDIKLDTKAYVIVFGVVLVATMAGIKAMQHLT